MTLYRCPNQCRYEIELDPNNPPFKEECPYCGFEVVHKKGLSPGDPYKFWGCPAATENERHAEFLVDLGKEPHKPCPTCGRRLIPLD